MPSARAASRYRRSGGRGVIGGLAQRDSSGRRRAGRRTRCGRGRDRRSGGGWRGARAGAAMQEQDRDARWIARLLLIDLVRRRPGQIAGLVGFDFGEQVLGGHCALTSDLNGAQEVVRGRSGSLNPQIRLTGDPSSQPFEALVPAGPLGAGTGGTINSLLEPAGRDLKERIAMTRTKTTPTWRQLALLTAALGALAGSGCATGTSPATGRTFSTPISEQQEAQLGREEHPKILEEFGGEYQGKAGAAPPMSARSASSSPRPPSARTSNTPSRC